MLPSMTPPAPPSMTEATGPLPEPAKSKEHVIHVYELISDSDGFKFHVMVWPSNGERVVTVYDDTEAVAVSRVKKLLDAPAKYGIKP